MSVPQHRKWEGAAALRLVPAHSQHSSPSSPYDRSSYIYIFYFFLTISALVFEKKKKKEAILYFVKKVT